MAKEKSLKNLIDIYLTAARVGAFTFGGGYAMLPILQKEVVEKKKWNTQEEILDYYALAQCLPGIIMVNTLSFTGEKRGGKLGAIMGSVGAVTPSLIIILLIAMVLKNFADAPMVQDAFAGIRVCVCVLIFNSVIKLWKNSVVDALTLAILVAVAGISFFTNLSPIIFVIASAIIGILASGNKKAGVISDSKKDGDNK